MSSKHIHKKNFFHLLFFLVFLPFVLINNTFSIKKLILSIKHRKPSDIFPKEKIKLRILFKNTIVALFLFPLCIAWIAGYLGLILALGLLFGLIPLSPQTEGNSMLPTLKNEEYVYAYPSDALFLHRAIHKGDIVVFSDTNTIKDGQQVDFIKRIVAVPNDQIEIRNGYLFINGKQQTEDYVLKPRSTFGNTFLKDCQKLTVPNNSYFVLGDNRKRSKDSRMFGFVPRSAIYYYLPKDKQQKYSSRWTKVTNEDSNDKGSFLDVDQYVALLNKKREESKLKPLKLEPKLSKSAESRAKIMLKYNDLSFEATKSGYTMAKATADAHYYNTVYGEFPILGYYDAQELIDYEFEYPESKEFLLNKDYQEIGISTFVGDLEGCPIQTIVQHLAGYIPPNYTKEQIEGWKKLLSDLRGVQPGWQGLKEQTDFYQKNKSNVDRINELISTRIANIEVLVRRMEANQWLTKQELDYTYQDENLYKEMNTIADRLNSQ